MEKSNTVRYCLNLNSADPLHRTAITALNAQGRRKSQFVVNAIIKYIMDGGDNAVTRQIDRKEIEDIVIAFLRERNIGKNESNKLDHPEPNPSGRVIDNTTQYENPDIAEDDLSLISDSLNCFKKK